MAKGYIGGKYSGTKRGTGYYGRNEAGVRPDVGAGESGQKREFEGSDSRPYTFYKEGVGYFTVVAHSMEEALRLAKHRGFTRKNYRKR